MKLSLKKIAISKRDLKETISGFRGILTRKERREWFGLKLYTDLANDLENSFNSFLDLRQSVKYLKERDFTKLERRRWVYLQHSNL